ncbi:hypothetical protein PV05_07203 [Exophiala xenobiotica]|uniref:Isochorismatase-like domain-containing protein n=1 Tax=Exophiala xenobiotica TaxID=348802 RepID=A0A0D2CXG9_9EURO|nr:uncharacterized protein PV05_07203 [Exophiala xenobiotica]KIW54872.1 hypothetical protein PV05_07203 [Exophiala xenobiotica]
MSYHQPLYQFEKLDKDKANYTTTEFRNNVLAHAEFGKLFGLPVIMTTSAETGPNGPLPKEILEMYPNAPLIKRNGEVNAWDNPKFKAAVEATGRKQIILGGIVTEVCTMFLALALREAGYSVWANTEASGTATPKLAEDANRRMEGAGVHLTGMFGIAMFLMKDWRNTPGTAEVLPFLDKYFPAYGIVARAHGSAKLTGDIVPGEQQLLG